MHYQRVILMTNLKQPPWNFTNCVLWVQTAFLQFKGRRLFETIWHVEELTVEMLLPEDGASDYWNMWEY